MPIIASRLDVASGIDLEELHLREAKKRLSKTRKMILDRMSSFRLDNDVISEAAEITMARKWMKSREFFEHSLASSFIPVIPGVSAQRQTELYREMRELDQTLARLSKNTVENFQWLSRLERLLKVFNEAIENIDLRLNAIEELNEFLV